jgi:heat shock protein HtpX
MSIYTQKASNIRKTWLLFTFFLIIVIGIGYVFSGLYGNSSILVIAVLFSSVTSLISYWYSDKIVLGMYRAQPVSLKEAPELYRVVENLAITAGLPTPTIYIIPDLAPNAFATGRDPKHAVIAVTQGLLNKMDQTELEAVIAHEMSHIGNRDMLLSTAAVILVGFVSLLADFFRRSVFWGGIRGRDDERGGNAIFMIIGIALSILAPIAAILIQLAISRRRESLADTSGSLLTRYPQGMISALQKIASDQTPMRTANNTTAHLLFENPFENKEKTPFLHKLFMTHPPIADRIAALKAMKI